MRTKEITRVTSKISSKLSLSFEVVQKGNIAKFLQNAELKKFLIGTGSKILVEASPKDNIWGIGLEESSPDATEPHKWLGENLLGFTLMEVRDILLETQSK